jgi:hypothetical protein
MPILDAAHIGRADPQDSPQRRLDPWEDLGELYLSEEDKRRRARFGLDDEEEEA